MRIDVRAVLLAAAILLSAGRGEDGGTVDGAQEQTGTTVTNVLGADRRLTTTLTGAAVPPTPVGSGGQPQDQGDTDGAGTARVDLGPRSGQLRYEVSVQSIDTPLGCTSARNSPADTARSLFR